MSLRELARRINVSAGFVSQLERNKANASVGTLYALVEALGLSIDQLLSRGPEPRRPQQVFSEAAQEQFAEPDTGLHVHRPTVVAEPVQRADNRPRIEFPGVIWERLTQTPDPLVDFLHVEYAPGSSSCPANDMMHHGGREYGFVLTGRLQLQIGFEQHDLSSGDAVTFDSMSPHRLSNPFDEPCRAIWVVMGRRRDDRGHDVPTPSGAVTHLPSLGS